MGKRWFYVVDKWSRVPLKCATCLFWIEEADTFRQFVDHALTCKREPRIVIRPLPYRDEYILRAIPTDVWIKYGYE